MIDYEGRFGSIAAGRQTFVASAFKLVYGWMAAGLALSGVVALLVAGKGLTAEMGQGMFLGLAIAELALVFVLSAAINKLPLMVAYLMFFVYAALNGVTLSVIFIIYPLATIETTFFVTAAMFAGLAVWGTITKSNLSSVGSICGMAVWGILIAMIVNMFVGSAQLDWLVSIVGVLAFTGLTMYDAQKIKALADNQGAYDSVTLQKVGILGALTLYLDFINLFLFLLRLMSGKSRD